MRVCIAAALLLPFERDGPTFFWSHLFFEPPLQNAKRHATDPAAQSILPLSSMPAPNPIPVYSGVAGGLVGNPGRVQEVADPGFRQRQATVSARRSAALKAEIDSLTKQVNKLERKLADKTSAAGSEAPDLAELISNLKALTDAAIAEEGGPTSSGLYGAGGRPTTAPYRNLSDSASIVSWSADAYGKSKTPGWYHTCRKQVYQQRAQRAAQEPTGCYISHSK